MESGCSMSPGASMSPGGDAAVGAAAGAGALSAIFIRRSRIRRICDFRQQQAQPQDQRFSTREGSFSGAQLLLGLEGCDDDHSDEGQCGEGDQGLHQYSPSSGLEYNSQSPLSAPRNLASARRSW